MPDRPAAPPVARQTASPSGNPTAGPAAGTAARRGWPRPLRVAAWAAGLVALGAAALQAFASFAVDPLLRWAAPRWVAEHTGHRLSIGQARLQPWRLAIELDDLALQTPDGAPLAALGRLALDVDGASLWRRALLIERLAVVQPSATLERRADGRTNWDAFLLALAGPAPAPPKPADDRPFPLRLGELALTEGSLRVQDRAAGTGGFAATLSGLTAQVSGLSSLDDQAAPFSVALGSDLGAALQARGQWSLKAQRGQGELSFTGVALPKLWPYLQAWLATAPVQGQLSGSTGWRAALGGPAPDLALDRLSLTLQDLAVAAPQAATPGLALGRVSLTGGQLDLAARRLGAERLAVAGGRLALVRGAQGDIDWQAWFKAPAAGPAAAAPAGAPPPAARPWQLQLGALAVDDVALQWRDQALAAPLQATVGRLALGLGLAGEVGDGPPALRAEGLSLALDDLRLASAGGPAWLTLAQARLAEGQVDTATRRLQIGPVTLQGGRLQAERAADGRLSPLAGLQPVAAGRPAPRGGRSTAAPPTARTAPSPTTASAVSSPAAASPEARPAPAAAADAPWRLAVGPVALSGFALQWLDRGQSPPLQLGLKDLRAELTGLTEDLAQPLRLTLAVVAVSGGRATVQGRLVPARPAADLRLRVEGLALQPAAPYVARATAMALRDGQVGTEGRLQLDGPRWRYEGRAAVERLRLDERASGEPLLAWQSLSTPQLAVLPEGLTVGELTLDGLVGKLTVFKDRSVNLVKALQPPPADGEVPPAPGAPTATSGAGAASAPSAASGAPAPVPAPAASAAAPAFAVAVERLRLRRAEVDFADLSLALPFAARVHDLNGDVVGLANRPDAVARLELEGRVDEFGLARASGQLRPMDATGFMDVAVQFRNVEMTSLTPYSATFAGRRIDSGKLSLDLQYKITDRQLLGENQILMDKLVLGARVEAPGALDLPLDLAIALLQDSDGRIDLGLPVSGSLDDPQFGYGQIVWKAIRTVLTKLVTAPFRALASLLGGGDDQVLDRIDFDPGRADLLPPEREKLKRLAEGLAKRPALALTVPAPFDPQADAAALRVQAVRLALAQAAGRSLAEGEAPGPVATTDPATQRLLEAAFTQRFGAPALAELRRTMPKPVPVSISAPAAAPVLAPVPPGSAPAPGATAAPADGLHDQLLARLEAAQPLPPEALTGLGGQRAAAVVAELARLGVAAGRVQADAPAERPAERVADGPGAPPVSAVLAVRVGARPAPGS